jgi:hypothetical protein
VPPLPVVWSAVAVFVAGAVVAPIHFQAAILQLGLAVVVSGPLSVFPLVPPLGSIVVPILPGDYTDLELRPVGRLTVVVAAAQGLRNTVTMGTSDPLAVCWVRPLFKNQTKKALNTLNPVSCRPHPPACQAAREGPAVRQLRSCGLSVDR